MKLPVYTTDPVVLTTGNVGRMTTSLRGTRSAAPQTFYTEHFGLGQGDVAPHDFGAHLTAINAKAIVVKRWSALGDVFMAAVACDFLQRVYGLPVFLDCDPRHDAGWTAGNAKFSCREAPPKRDVVTLILDHAFEASHLPKTDRLYWGLNRMRKTLYLGGIYHHDGRWFVRRNGSDVPLEIAPDWCVVVPTPDAQAKALKRLADRGLDRGTRRRPLAAVNGFSATSKYRSLTSDRFEAAVRGLVAAGFSVVITDARAYPWASDPTVKDFVMETKGTSVGEALTFYREADVAVTCDSAPLWMAHAAGVPLVFWGGSSTTGELLADFPPDRVRVVAQAVAVGCTPCDEHAEACDHAVACQREVSADWLTEETVAAAHALAGRPV